MKAYIASNDSFVTTNLRTSLQRLGLECPPSQILSQESAVLLNAKDTANAATVIFFAAQQLSTDELILLKQLCAGGNQFTKVVMVGSKLSPELILQAIRAGAADCLDVAGNLEAELREVLRRITALPQNGCHLGRLFSVVGAGGGAGTSLIAANVATVLAQRGCATGLLDLHIRGGDTAVLMACEPLHTLASLAAKKDQLDQAMFEQSLVKHKSGVQFLASPEPFSDFRSFRPELILKIVQLARQTFTHIVLDLEDCEHQEQVRVLAASERIVLVMRPDFISLHRARKCIEFLTRAKVPREHITVVANRLGSAKALEPNLIEEALGMRIEHRLPEEPEPVNASVNLGTPIVIAYPKSKVAQGIVHLVDSLTGVQPNPTATSWPWRQLNRLRSTMMNGAVHKNGHANAHSIHEISL